MTTTTETVLQSLLDISNTDTSALNKLDILIDICTEEAKAYTNQTDETVLRTLIIPMVCERWTKIGSEGLSSASFNGVNESFLDDYSQTVQRLLRAKRRLRCL